MKRKPTTATNPPEVVNITEKNDIYKGTVETTIKVDGVAYEVKYEGEMNGCNNDDGGYSINLTTVKRAGKLLKIDDLPRRLFWMLSFKIELDFIDRIIPPHSFVRREAV